MEDGAMPEPAQTQTTPASLAAPQPTAPPSAPVQPSAEPDNRPPAQPSDTLGDAGKKALDEERRARKDAEKARKDLEDRLRAIEDKDKSELERAQSRLAELETSYAASEAQRLRLQVATAHNIGSDDLVLLTAGTEEDLVAQAQRIAALNAHRAAAQATPAFASAPGQHAGNGAPAPEKSSIARGRDMYRRRRGTVEPRR